MGGREEHSSPIHFYCGSRLSKAALNRRPLRTIKPDTSLAAVGFRKPRSKRRPTRTRGPDPPLLRQATFAGRRLPGSNSASLRAFAWAAAIPQKLIVYCVAELRPISNNVRVDTTRAAPRRSRARPCPEAPLLAPQAKKAQEARGQGRRSRPLRIHAVM